MPETTPTTDLPTAVARFTNLIAARPGSRVPASKGRHLVRQAVYGDLWHPDRISEVPPQQRPALRALAKQIIDVAFPGGAYAKSMTAANIRALWTPDTRSKEHPMPQPTLTTYGGPAIPIGGTAELDGNLPVTVTAIEPPCEEGDYGTVTIRHSWGASEDVDPVRLNAYIST
jgi:hypothetical protein